MSISRSYGGIMVMVLSFLAACSSGGLSPGSGCPQGQHYEDGLAAANSREKIPCVTNNLCNEDETCSQQSWHCVPKSTMNCSADKDCTDTRIPRCVFLNGTGFCSENKKTVAWACVSNYEENVLCQFNSGGVSREVGTVCISGTCDSGRCTKPTMVDGDMAGGMMSGTCDELWARSGNQICLPEEGAQVRLLTSGETRTVTTPNGKGAWAEIGQYAFTLNAQEKDWPTFKSIKIFEDDAEVSPVDAGRWALTDKGVGGFSTPHPAFVTNAFFVGGYTTTSKFLRGVVCKGEMGKCVLAAQ